MRKERGFTLLEITVSLTIIAIILAVAAPAIAITVWETKVRGGIEEAKKVVSVCELARVVPLNAVRSSASDMVLVNSTYRSPYTNWSNASLLKSMLSGNSPVPNANPFDKPYVFRMYEHYCEVGFDLDKRIESWEGYRVEQVGSFSRIIVDTPATHHLSPEWVRLQKRFLHEESSR